MKNIEQLNDWQDDVRSGLRREIERLREKEEMLNSYMQLLDATSEFIDDMSDLTRELERSQAEVGSLSSELEEQQKETDSLLQQMKEEASSQRLEMQAAQAADRGEGPLLPEAGDRDGQLQRHPPQ